MLGAFSFSVEWFRLPAEGGPLLCSVCGGFLGPHGAEGGSNDHEQGTEHSEGVQVLGLEVRDLTTKDQHAEQRDQGDVRDR